LARILNRERINASRWFIYPLSFGGLQFFAIALLQYPQDVSFFDLFYLLSVLWLPILGA